MLTLRRTVRFSINPPGVTPGVEDPPSPNGFAANPAMRGLGRHYEIDVECRGEADPTTGYLVDIKTIDHAVRTAALPIIKAACADRPQTDPAALIGSIRDAVAPLLPAPIERIRWRLSPYYAVEMATTHPDRVLLRQKFDFAAAHRLHIPSLSEADNRKLFGKCNNPAGHGHNYQIEPVVALPASSRFTLADLERLTESAVIDRFDHKHLNCDTEEFAQGTGLNPSVENMARIFFGLLSAAITAQFGSEAALVSMTVWETDRTCATYPA